MIRTSLDVMGTVFTVMVADDTPTDVIEEVGSWWRHVEAEFSTFLTDSQISRIGRGALEVDDADREVRHVLAVCAELEEQTGGRFSIRPATGSSLDPAGYVKGWSVDEAALLLHSAGVADFAVYAGGDVLCSGRPDDADTWQIGIRMPHDPDSIGAVVSVSDGAVASSGTYRRGAHIWGATDRRVIAGATVVGPRLGIADALATAVMAGQDESFEWMNDFSDYSVVVFTPDGQIRWSEALGDRIILAGTSSTAVESAPPGNE